MTISQLIKQMIEAGAPMEAVQIAIEFIEQRDRANDVALAKRREADRARKAKQRSKSRDITVTSQGHPRDLSPPSLYSNNIYPPSQHTFDVDNSRRVKRASNGTRLPSDWTPTQEDRLFAADLLPFWETEVDKFKDYWAAKAGQGATKKDWSATWRNWCRNAHERSRPPRKADAAPNLMEIYAARARESEAREREQATVLAFGRK